MKLSKEQVKEHLDKKTFISHVVLDSIPKGFLNDYKGELNIELKINGHECNFEKFVDTVSSQLIDLVNWRAKKIINEKCGAIDEIEEYLIIFKDDIINKLNSFKFDLQMKIEDNTKRKGACDGN